MLLKFTEISTNQVIAINPSSITSVFFAPEGEYKGKTVITIGQQPIILVEDFNEVVGQINGELK
jgi:hypothetical protein